MLAALLIAIVGSCPIWCATIEPGHGHAAAAPDSHPFGAAPVNDDDCVCNGAIRAADAPTSSLSSHLHPGAPLDLPLLTGGGAPGPAGWDMPRPDLSPGRWPGPGPRSRMTSLRC